MSNLSFVCKLFIFYIILEDNIIKSFINPDFRIRLKHGNHLINFSPRNDKPKFYSSKITNILCPLGATGIFSKTLNNFKNCPGNKIYNLIHRKCMPIDSPKIPDRNTRGLYNCPQHDQQKHFYPYDARKYIQCHNGQLLVLDCRPLEMFSILNRCCLPETEIPENDHVPMPALPKDKNDANVPIVYTDKIYCPLSLFGVFPHPFNNTKYLKCVEGRLYDKYCAPGFVFDFMSKLCVENNENLFNILPAIQQRYTNESVLETRIADNLTFLKCPNSVNDTFVHPFSCVDYISCSPAGTKIFTCPSNKIYSFRKKKCEIESRTDEYDHVPCIEDNSVNDEEEWFTLGVVCAPTGLRNYPHPRSQYKYVNCNDGQLRVIRCPRNEIFNLDELECKTEQTMVNE